MIKKPVYIRVPAKITPIRNGSKNCPCWVEVKFTPSYRCKTTPFGTRVKSTPYGTRVKITHPVGGGGGVKITLFGGGSKLLSKPGALIWHTFYRTFWSKFYFAHNLLYFTEGREIIVTWQTAP